MKLHLYLIFLLFHSLSQSQFDPSKFYLLENNDTDILTPVKEIEIFYLNMNDNKIDTGTVVKQFYHKNGNPKKRLIYRKPHITPFKIIEFDTLGRISIGNASYRIGYHTEKFYYTNNRKIPDSIKDFYMDSLLVSQYKNYFKNDKIIRQDYIRNDTLRTFFTLEYDSTGRLIRKIKHNTIYGTGISFGKGFTKSGKTEKVLDPNDTTLYKHKIKNDTLITYIYKKRQLNKIEKKISNGNLKIDISKSYFLGYLNEREINYKWSDSTVNIKEGFDKSGNVTRYSYINSNPEKIQSRHNYLYKEKISVVYIKIRCDEKGNWINKEYYRDEKLTHIISRKIKYFGH